MLISVLKTENEFSLHAAAAAAFPMYIWITGTVAVVMVGLMEEKTWGMLEITGDTMRPILAIIEGQVVVEVGIVTMMITVIPEEGRIGAMVVEEEGTTAIMMRLQHTITKVGRKRC